MRWRFGGDLGTNSLGWCAVELGSDSKPFRIISIGSRIFSDGRDPKSKQSLAVDRRAARAMSRGRDRFQQRQRALLNHLTAAGLFPPNDDVKTRKALEDLDPFALRALALDEPLLPQELGRALFHINQRRGFKSNRKADRKDDESGKIRVGVARLQEEMIKEGAATFGQFLHFLRFREPDDNHIPSVRTRLRPEPGDGKGDGYDFYPDRKMLEDEFRTILDAQAPHHPDLLTGEVCERLFQVVFHQRPLKAPKIGTCTLVPGEDRLPKAHPLFQERRLLEELNALRIVRVGEVARPLTLDQRNALYMLLKGKRKDSFDSLRKLLKLDPGARFNKERDTRKDLKGDEVAPVLSDKKRFDKRWALLSLEAQWTVIKELREAASDADVARLKTWLQAEHHLTPEQASATVDAPLPEGFGRFGITATRDLIDALRAEVIVYSDAVKVAGLGHHSDFRTGEVLDELPYYGEVLERHIMPGTGQPGDPLEMRVGRLTNPTVHIGLNQLRHVVNRLIKAYGPPEEIALELARELKLDEKRKDEINRKNRQNREAAEQRSAKLEELGIADKGSNRALMKLWEELNRENVLDRRCVYTGAKIGMEMLFSSAVEVDHILPFATTLDDSGGNRILCLREANREKRKQSPWEAFGEGRGGPRYVWDEIAARAARLPPDKRWRFEPNALQRFEKDGGFLARQLKDTQYLSRLAREYVSALYPGIGEDSGKVWVSPGRLTEMLRRKWGLNELLPDHNLVGGGAQPKNRMDHRHHAIDAVVIAVTDRSLLQRISTEAGRWGPESGERLIPELFRPWESFRDDLRTAVNAVTASHRPDHGTASKAALPKGRDATAGRLHNDTAYGLTGVKENGVDLVVHRVPLDALKPDDLVEGGRRVADEALREAMAVAAAGLEGKAFTQALRQFAKTHKTFNGVRRVRVLEPLSVIPIRDAQGRAYKAYKGDANYRCDVWETRDGRWALEVVSMFDAHQPGWASPLRAANPTARKVLSLQGGDLIAMGVGEDRRLLRVVALNPGRLVLADPNASGELKKRHEVEGDPFRYVFASGSRLKADGARQVRIDELGRVQDPGPRSPPPAVKAAA